MSNWFTPPVSGEVSLEEIEEMASSGKFHEWNFEPFESQENGYEDVLDEIKKYSAVDYLALEEKYKLANQSGNAEEASKYKAEMEAMVDAVLKIYREKDILPIQYYSDFGIMDEIEKCISYKAKFDGNTVSCVDGRTEYFNGIKWKTIDSYTEGDKVLQYNADGTAELVEPIRYIHQRNDDTFYIMYDEDSDYLSMVLTGNHSVVYRDDNDKLCKATAEELLNSSESYVKIPCSYCMKDSEYSVHAEDNLIADIVLCLRTGKEDLNGYVSTESGKGCLTDKVFRLDLDSRSRLCTVLGLSGPCTGISAMDNDSDHTSKPDLMLMSVVNSLGGGLCELSFDIHEDVRYLCRISDDCAWISWKPSVSPISTKDNSISDQDKYCFEVPSHMLVLRRGGIPFVTGNCGAGIGTTLCNYLFPNIFDTPSAHDLEKKNARSLYEKFHNDEYLRRAIKFCFSYKDGCPVPTNVMGGLRLVGSAPTNFRPMNAKAVYERFCPKGGVIYDFCMGFGGRMLGALSSKNNYRYVGTDPCTETFYHLNQLGEWIESVTGREDSYELHCCGSEDFRGPANSVDFAFSSPPYFNLEVYSDEETQCYNKFPELEQWLEGYVRQTIKNIYHMLKPGALYAVNIADFKVGSGSEVAYVDEWKRISEEEGMPLFDTVYLGVTARAGSAEQAAGELKKENIMLFKKSM